MKEPVIVVINSTQPNANLLVNTTSNSSATIQVSFSISMRRLVERDTQGNIISELPLMNSEIVFDYLESAFNNSANSLYEYSTILSNGAIVNITVSS